MNQTIAIADIKPNPFQSRKTVDPGAVKRLATEIQDTGFWGGGLRVRQENGAYELVFGHQRLAALRQLGHKRVNVEVVKLTDVEMAEQSLTENLQRHNLLEIDKAEAIKRLFEMEKIHFRSKVKDREIINRLMTLLGYASDTTIYEFLGMSRLSDDTKRAVRANNMPRGAAAAAQRIGGDAMVKHAATHRISQLALTPINKILAPLDDPLREKVVKTILKDELTTPAQVEKIARQEQAKTVKKKEVPPNLMVFIEKWTGDLNAWRRKLAAAGKHKAYIHEHPEVATAFKDAAEAFIVEIKGLLNL